MTRLYIGTPSRNQEINELGDKGAQTIACSLKQLAYLNIGIRCNYTGNNKMSDKGAMAIADNLSQLAELHICTASQLPSGQQPIAVVRRSATAETSPHDNHQQLIQN